ncbi:MAG: DUF3014 domain-containing protein [Methylosarcina sp.]
MGRYHQTKLNFGRYDRTKKKKFGGWLVLMTITAFILLAAWLYFNQEQTADLAKHETRILRLPPAGTGTDKAEDQPETFPAKTEPVPENVQAESEPETVAVLPALDNSDGFVREELLKLSPSLVSWFDTPQMLRKFLLIVNDFSQGSRLEKNMRFLKPKQSFTVDQDASGLYMAPAGYHRYDSLAAAINAVDDKAAVAFYKNIRPLLLQVYAEFSYPAGYKLEDLFRKAAAEIISAPIRTERLAVVRPSVHYKFADPALEALNPVHKQMLRLGPENTKIIQNKLRRLVEALSENRE